ncbi:MAG: hypothetical protein GC182_09080 [Rhodopseudomonas sp.]|nr:hypothetical protein [Rhodopseudomonas sp.]
MTNTDFRYYGLRMKRKRLNSVEDVLAALGGTGAIIVMTGRSPQAISGWRSEGRIPPKYFYLMTEALELLEMEADPELWGMVATGVAA